MTNSAQNGTMGIQDSQTTRLMPATRMPTQRPKEPPRHTLTAAAISTMPTIRTTQPHVVRLPAT
ncbi:MAG: hypothetical protein BWY94_02398 [Actinobacteria bacterium ADurb.BinA094]|nr:MAG: hypothetical protein BWY94_02398 [Actinobacteria bacterium ADurb.BinA094]